MGVIKYEKVASASTESFGTTPIDEDTAKEYTIDRLSEEETDSGNHSRHKRSFQLDPRVVSNAVLGLSDGMTVPFALTAGLSELGDNRVVVLAGLAELIAGAISMGLGGYLGALSEQEIYKESSEQKRRSLRFSSRSFHLVTSQRITSAFSQYQIPSTILRDLTSHFVSPRHRQYLPGFLLKVEHGVDEPADSHAISCALTIAAGYFFGGLIPLLPYLLVPDRKNVGQALSVSVVTMAVALFVLGYGKACLIAAVAASQADSVSSSSSSIEEGCATGDVVDDDRDSVFTDGREQRQSNRGRMFGSSVYKGIKGGLQMLVVGGLSAACAVILVKLFNSFL